jgi:hypothetical protein
VAATTAWHGPSWKASDCVSRAKGMARLGQNGGSAQ